MPNVTTLSFLVKRSLRRLRRFARARKRPSGRGAEDDIAVLSGRRAALAWLSVAAGPRRLSRRRHGARQDDPGSRAAADGQRGRRRAPAEPHRRAGVAHRHWAAEAERFAPSLNVFVAHPAFTPAELLKSTSAEDLVGIDLVVTSYAALLRLDWLGKTRWRLAVVDEALAIKRRPARSRRRSSRGASAASARTATGRRPTNLTAAQPVAIWTSYSSVEATPSP